jgi:hypothetical protein
MRRWVFAAALLAAAPAARAQAPVPPDPATVQLPDLTPTNEPEVINDGWKYFYFHRAGVTYAQAFADFAECYRFLAFPATAVDLPTFTPWGEPIVARSVRPGPTPYGIVGAAIGALVAGSVERRAYQSRLRRCLEPRGYVRYPLRKEVWEQLVDDFSERSLARQALAASGPTPNLPRVTP